MNFLKRHYEKILLATLLIVFIGAMFYLLKIAEKMKSITAEKMTLIIPDPDFGKMSEERGIKFDYEEVFASKGTEWAHKHTDPAKVKFGVASNLFEIPGMAKCGHCGRFISLAYFDNKACPYKDCGKILTKPMVRESVTFKPGIKSAQDPDGCGIPHIIKKKYNLSTDAKDRENVLEDMDGDGFSNLYEYRNRKDMNNPRNHPPLWHRLVLLGIEKVRLPIVYKAVNKMDSPDQKEWYFQINNLNDYRLDDTYKLGATIGFDIDGVEYKISDTELKDENVITLIPVTDKLAKPIIMKLGEEVYSPEPKVLFLDLGTNESLIVDSNRPFRMGNASTGVIWYKVMEINREKQEIAIGQRLSNKRFARLKTPITTKGIIPLNERILNRNNKQTQKKK